MKVRIKFSKYGPVKFIGHLDVMRYFQKAIRRAEIDIAYSEGFSPHPVMSFASPLSVGHTSQGEYFDIEANSFTSEEDLLQRLQGAMVEGFTVSAVKLLPEGEGNAMASVAAASYFAAFKKTLNCRKNGRNPFRPFINTAIFPSPRRPKKGKKKST